jgi:two-component system response regulator AtoC
MSLILIADDDKNLRYSFKRAIEREGFQCVEAKNGREAVERVAQDRPQVVVMDIRMPEMDGLKAFLAIKKIASDLPVIIMTAYGTTETAIEAMKRGAFEYILKPFNLNDMLVLIARAIAQNSDDVTQWVDLKQPLGAPAEVKNQLVGSSLAMQKVFKAIGQLAESDIPVLISGESGTGKELVARTIHAYSKRKGAPFLPINCAAIPDSLFESELFGHEKGAFTGAEQPKMGLLQTCDKGTVFLDEVTEIPFSAQAKLLRFLQEGEFIRIGDEKPVRVDVRVVAASNVNLKDAVDGKTFREDLFYRLNAASIALPPLRDRPEDLEETVSYFVSRFNKTSGKHFARISKQAIEALWTYDWPGNVRELENVIRRAVVVGHGDTLQREHLFPDTLDSLDKTDESLDEQLREQIRTTVIRCLDMTEEENYPLLIPLMEQVIIAEVLERVGGNQVRAAQVLGISRNTLRSRIEKFGL